VHVTLILWCSRVHFTDRAFYQAKMTGIRGQKK